MQKDTPKPAHLRLVADSDTKPVGPENDGNRQVIEYLYKENKMGNITDIICFHKGPDGMWSRSGSFESSLEVIGVLQVQSALLSKGLIHG